VLAEVAEVAAQLRILAFRARASLADVTVEFVKYALHSLYTPDAFPEALI
jgi:hypothetical protein